MDAPCYVPELDDTVYTKKDFLQLCNNQEEIAEELFEQLDWQSPSTLFNEWEDMGEQSRKLNNESVERGWFSEMELISDG